MGDGAVQRAVDAPVAGPKLSEALTRLHAAVQTLHLPRRAAGLDLVREEREHALRLLEAYTLPRLDEREAPLVVVIGGPTGAGKSTLVNSLIGDGVSLSGVMRPTTREPVMVYHPLDEAALGRIGLLEGNGLATGGDPSSPDHVIHPRPVRHDDVAPGLVLIDSPDLDSRLDSNRLLADRLLEIADLWMFVTTGTDYADALSWEALHRAARRQISVAAVLNRLRQSESRTVRTHFATLLRDAGLAHAYMFILPETRLIDERLPVQLLAQLESWLEKQARDQGTRHRHLTRAREGTLDEVVASVRRLADAIDDQVVAARRLRVDIEGVFSAARETIRQRCSDGSLITPELSEAWQHAAAPAVAEPAGSGLFRRRSRQSFPVGREAVLGTALRAAPAALLYEQVDQATFRAMERRRAGGETSGSWSRSRDVEERVDAATQVWLNRVHRRVHGPEADVAAAHRDPVTLAVATLGVLPRPGHLEAGPVDLAETSGVDVEAVEAVTDLVAHQLTEADRFADAAALGQDAWLDLVAALTVVVNQEESEQIDAFEAVPIPGETAATLREHVDELTRLRRLPEA